MIVGVHHIRLPCECVDLDGRLVVFINEMNLISSENDYWGGFDNAVMRRLSDYNRLDKDESHGGAIGLYDNLNPYDRKLYSKEQGRDDEVKIFKLISDKIKETIFL